MVDELVMRGTPIVVPAILQQTVVTLAHEDHQGMLRTKQYLRTNLWFPGMNQMVESEVKRCMACQASTDIIKKELLKPTELQSEPWSRVATDIFGPSSTGKYIPVA